jgi:hypothetical protein
MWCWVVIAFYAFCGWQPQSSRGAQTEAKATDGFTLMVELSVFCASFG